MLSVTLRSALSRLYMLNITTSDSGLDCDSDSGINVTFIHNTSSAANSVWTVFTPALAMRDSKLITFNASDIGKIEYMKLEMVNGANGWCFDKFDILIDYNYTHKIWAYCDTIGYNAQNSIAIDNGCNMIYSPQCVEQVTLDVRQGDSSVCNIYNVLKGEGFFFLICSFFFFFVGINYI